MKKKSKIVLVPIITSIKPQKNKKRVNVYLDNKFGFGIDLDNFVLSKIKINQELSDEKVAEIVEKSEFQKTLDKLLMFATLRPRSKKEIRDYFKRKKVHDSLHEDLFGRLDHLRLINDEEFTKWWVDQRNAFRPKSKSVLKQELRIKGVEKDIIENVLSDVEIDESKFARQLIEKRLYKWKSLEPRMLKQKAFQYLQSKGFPRGVIDEVLNDI